MCWPHQDRRAGRPPPQRRRPCRAPRHTARWDWSQPSSSRRDHGTQGQAAGYTPLAQPGEGPPKECEFQTKEFIPNICPCFNVYPKHIFLFPFLSLLSPPSAPWGCCPRRPPSISLHRQTGPGGKMTGRTSGDSGDKDMEEDGDVPDSLGDKLCWCRKVAKRSRQIRHPPEGE